MLSGEARVESAYEAVGVRWVRWNGESLLPGPLGSVWQSQGGERRAQPPAPCLLPERLAPTTVEVEAGAEAEAAAVAC